MSLRLSSKSANLPWGWFGFFGIIVCLALVTAFAALRGGRQFVEREAPLPALIRVIVAGQPRLLSLENATELAPRLEQTLTKSRAEVLQHMQRQIDANVEKIFNPVLARVSDFAHWYYSLQGEYTRYASAVTGNMAEFLERRLYDQIFAPAQLETSLDKVLQELNSRARHRLRATLDAVTNELDSFLSTHAEPEPEKAGETVQIENSLDLDTILKSSIRVGAKDINRQMTSALVATGVGTAVGKGLGAVVLKNSIAKIAGTKSFQTASVLLAKLAAKSALKSSGSLGAAAAGTAICAPGGPAALLCGAIAGVVAWVVVDKAIIELDEVLHREAFENDIRGAIEEQRDRLKRQLKAAYQTVLNEHFAILKQDIGKELNELKAPEGEFTPAEEL